MTELWIVLIVVVIILVLKIIGRRGKICGPKCQFPTRPEPKKRLTYSEKLSEIRKKIEQAKKKRRKNERI